MKMLIASFGMFRARVRHLLFWEMATVSLLHASQFAIKSLCGVCKSLLVPRDWCSVAVSPNPWFDVHFFLWVIATQLLILFFSEHVPFSWSIVSCGVPCSGSRVGKMSLFVTSTLEHLGLCASQVSIYCHFAVFRVFVDSFVDQVGLGLSLCLMDKYLWEHIQIYLDRDDLLCLRVVARFHATCEWFGPGWTVVLSPLVHVVRRPAWDQSQDLPRFSGVWILEKWVSFTTAVCALLLDVRGVGARHVLQVSPVV